jgi:hypothetical protein
MTYLRAFLNYLKTAPLLVQIVGVIGLCTLTYFFARSGALNVLPKKDEGKPASAGTTTQTVTVIANGSASVGDYAQGGQPASQAAQDIQAANFDAMAQQKAANWHNAHVQEDNPPWIPIYPTGKKVAPKAPVVVTYRYFHDSDGCLEVVHSENGKIIDKWVPNPLPAHRIHDDARILVPHSPTETPDQVKELALGMSMNELSEKLRRLLPPVRTVLAAGQNASPVQVPSGPQFCLNPHPGTYTWSWGAVNGCQQPQFRNFADGCSHYQIFNVCAGVWEPQIYWTFCRAH